MEEKQNAALLKAEKIANKGKAERQRKTGSGEKRKSPRPATKTVERETDVLERKIKRKKSVRKAEKNAEKKTRAKNGKNPMRGFITAVVILGSAALILGGALTYTLITPSENDLALESGYEKSFYGAVTHVDNMDLNLSKVIVAADKRATQKYLVDATVNAELCENDLQELPLPDESKYYTTKLVNQVGDFCKYLNNKIIDGQSITEEEYEDLERLLAGVLELKASLNDILSEMGEFSFTSLEKDGIVLKDFDELQNLSATYPELIYDGPFSDARDDEESPAMLSGDELSKELVGERFSEIFAPYGLEDAKFSGEVHGDVEGYSYTGTVDGKQVFAILTKAGGNLAVYTATGDAYVSDGEEDEKATDGEIAAGLAFLNRLGYENMKAVWSTAVGGYAVMNFVTEADGVIFYGEMVKVKVERATKKVVGIEAYAYLKNKKERSAPVARVSEEDAAGNLSAKIDVASVRLAVIPLGETAEELCYEFMGTYGGTTYYIYISALDGRQKEMFKVVEGTEGQLLM